MKYWGKHNKQITKNNKEHLHIMLIICHWKSMDYSIISLVAFTYLQQGYAPNICLVDYIKCEKKDSMRDTFLCKVCSVLFA